MCQDSVWNVAGRMAPGNGSVSGVQVMARPSRSGNDGNKTKNLNRADMDRNSFEFIVRMVGCFTNNIRPAGESPRNRSYT